MKTYVLNINEEQEKALQALIDQLHIEASIYSEKDEDTALSLAMEEGKKYGRLSEGESNAFLEGLGKWKSLLTEVLSEMSKSCPF